MESSNGDFENKNLSLTQTNENNSIQTSTSNLNSDSNTYITNKSNQYPKSSVSENMNKLEINNKINNEINNEINDKKIVVDPSKIVKRPIPKSDGRSQRQVEIEQINRRFKKNINIYPDDISYKITFPPSDPDFPFDLQNLIFRLTVPNDYPKSFPHILVLNKDIPRGFAINVERGFANLRNNNQSISLLQQINLLDRNLESFLKEDKATTIKIVKPISTNSDSQNSINKPSFSVDAKPFVPSTSSNKKNTKDKVVKFSQKSVTYDSYQLLMAHSIQERETKLLLARLKNSRVYQTTEEGIYYTIPITIPRIHELADPIKNVTTIRLFVPATYNLQPCTITLIGNESQEARNIEAAFLNHALSQSNFSLLAHINYLAENFSLMSKTITYPKSEDQEDFMSELNQDDLVQPPEWVFDIDSNSESGSESDIEFGSDSDEELENGDNYKKLNKQYLEDNLQKNNDKNDNDSIQINQESELYVAIDEMEQNNIEDNLQLSNDKIVPPLPSVVSAPHGTAISFPNIKLTGIELLECSSLNLMVRCIRCKELCELRGLRSSAIHTEKYSNNVSTVCSKCSAVLSMRFRGEFVHENNSRIGYLDIEGCTPFDFLPSNFIPTCFNCSTSLSTPGIKGLSIAQALSAFCRTCHNKMTAYITEVKFTQITNEGLDISALKLKKKKKENLGIISGTPLPNNGTCSHYKKSTRWFRFSCCQKVFPCDKCHNEKSDHIEEHANRIICGMCSREQNYNPSACAYCHHQFIRKSSGFWEGGKGTRDRVTMSRKDSRKHKRVVK